MSEITVKSEEILKSVKSIPALSPGASQLLDVLGGGKYEVSDIVKVIENDSALTVNVLKVVNSAAIGLRQEMASVHQAVSFLGDTKVIGIAMASAGRETFNAELLGYQGDRGMLGRHCLWVALAARELARHTNGVVDKGLAFTAGLLHDIGKAVVSDYMVELVPDIIKKSASDSGTNHLKAEQLVIGTDHCEVGGKLATHWKMPQSLCLGIEHHHKPANAPDEFKVMTYVLHLADTLAQMQGMGTGVDDLQYEFDGSYTDFIKLESCDLEGLALDVQIEFNATAEALFGTDLETE
ncbi:MAG: HDOD domain-containing protein [bacterium]|nr:HDOD domain-containing protein [bacterium]